jgi:hypothetical protein
MISSAMLTARSTGMANPRPMLPPLGAPEALGTVAPAVGTPTSWPSQLTSAPPLLPGLIDASVGDQQRGPVVLPWNLDRPVERAHDACRDGAR